MDYYSGQAVLVTGDGTEIPVKAVLSVMRPAVGLPSWSGRLDSNEDVFFDLLGKNLTLRMPDGRRGEVLVRSGAGPRFTSAEIAGSGPSPF